MFEKEAEEYAEAFESKGVAETSFQKGAEFGYNKAKEDVKHDLMMKLKDEGIVKVLKDSVFCNKKLSSQEQQELCAWIECAIDFGENLDECAKELEQIRNERNFFKEKCEDIEFNYYCDKLDCQFLSRNKWHYVKDGEYPKTKGNYLVAWERTHHIEEFGEYGFDVDLFNADEGYFEGVGDYVIAWKEIVLPKESE